jgi:hypothetical protein
MTEQEFLRSQGVPERGTPEWVAWETVVSWAQEDRDEETRLRLGDVIHAHYPKLIARIAEAVRAATPHETPHAAPPTITYQIPLAPLTPLDPNSTLP